MIYYLFSCYDFILCSDDDTCLSYYAERYLFASFNHLADLYSKNKSKLINVAFDWKQVISRLCSVVCAWMCRARLDKSLNNSTHVQWFGRDKVCTCFVISTSWSDNWQGNYKDILSLSTTGFSRQLVRSCCLGFWCRAVT
jgi:hypothetical protein